MGVYSVMIPEEKLKRAVDGFKRIVILGCEGCANESLSYDKNMPQKAVFDEHTKRNMPAPDAILEEALRLKVVLTNTVNDILVSSGMGLCSRSTSDKPDEWIKICNDAEAVLALSCAAGLIGIKKSLGKTIKVIPGMRTAGVLYSYRVFDSNTGLLYIDKARSAIIHFAKNNSDLDVTR
jgi:hypothetical protein